MRSWRIWSTRELTRALSASPGPRPPRPGSLKTRSWAGCGGRRLEQVAAQVRAHKAAATGPPPIAVLGWLFRPLAALGGYHWYMNHQHRFHTLVSHVRGPAE